MKVEKHKKEVKLCFLFLLFKLSIESDRVQSLEQYSEFNAADKVKIERVEKDIKQLYCFLPQSGSSLIPLALPRRFHCNPI